MSLVRSKEVNFDESILSTNQTSSDWIGIGNSTEFSIGTFRSKMNVVTVECELIGGRDAFRS